MLLSQNTILETEEISGFRISIVRLLSVLFVLSSIWTDTIGTLGQGITGRLVYSDLFGALGLFMFLFSLKGSRKIRIPKVIASYALFIGLLVPGLVVSINPTNTAIELLILFFLGLIFIMLVGEFNSKKGFLLLISIFALASLFAALVGSWNVLSSIIGLPRIPVVNQRSGILGIGTFRNTGQAGAYMLISLSVLIPVRVSKLYILLSSLQRSIVSNAIPACIIFLILSIKRASIIGFLIGVSIWIVWKASKGVFRIGRLRISLLIYFVVLLGFIYIFISFNTSRNQEWTIWWQYKVVGGVSNVLDEDSFISENFSSAIVAVGNNPLFGTGMAGFTGRYGRFEIHSTYLKMFGEAGLVGAVGYFLFIISFIRSVFANVDFENYYGSFLKNSIPFLIGCFISWSYTYHLRKREFWIMYAILFIAASLSRKMKNSPTVN